jgi:redox-sensing transcriptional repressor
MSATSKPSPRIVKRLSMYRRLLSTQLGEKSERIYSHELGLAAGVSAAQVRRDIMGLGHSGTPNNGYDISALISGISEQIDPPAGQQIALVGVGNLGRAILSYFSSASMTKLRIVAAFDVRSDITNRVLSGCRCYRLDQMAEILPAEQITTGIIAVPAEAAQSIADGLVTSGVLGILNFAPVPIKAPPQVYVEHMEITIKLETVAYFAQRTNG